LQRVEVQTRSEMNSVQNDLRILHADLVHGIESADGIEGLVILGEKKGGGVYTAEDLTYLHALAQITNVALQTARIRQQMERINDELQRKSEKLSDQGRQISILQAELMAANTDAETEADSAKPSAETPEFRRDALR